ncbi:MAG: PD-(D/E)XK nuclease family protein, partial [Rickettsiales bacterium]
FTHRKKDPSISDLFNEAIDVAMVAENAKQQPRTYVGVSMVGQSCERRIQYEYTITDKDPGKDFDGRTLRKFGAGHYFEDDTAALLRAAGFDLRTVKRDGNQFGFDALDGRFQGHIDGVIVGGPDWLKYPALWEHKAVGNKSYKKHQGNILEVANRVYASQVALYQAYLDLMKNPAVFTVRNTDTQELHFELVRFNAALAQEMSDRAVKIVSATDAGEQLPRMARSKDHFECKWCPFAARCWDGE